MMSAAFVIRVIIIVLAMHQIVLQVRGYSSDFISELLSSGHSLGKDITRNRRSILTFPTDSVLQITMGISLASKLERNNAVVILGFQQNAKLPNESQSFSFPSQVMTAKQFSIYHHLRSIISGYGFNGFECLKKMICQIAETPLTDGLLEDVITFVLSPSKHRNIGQHDGKLKNDDVTGLLESETFGKLGGNCSLAFPKCARTPLDLVSQLVHA